MSEQDAAQPERSVFAGENFAVTEGEHDELLFWARHALTSGKWHRLPRSGSRPEDATLYRLMLTDLVQMMFQLDLALDPLSDSLETDGIGEIAYEDDLYRIYIVNTDAGDSYQFFRMATGMPIPMGNDCSLLADLAQNVSAEVEDEMHELGQTQPGGEGYIDFITPPWPHADEVDTARADRLVPVSD